MNNYKEDIRNIFKQKSSSMFNYYESFYSLINYINILQNISHY